MRTFFLGLLVGLLGGLAVGAAMYLGLPPRDPCQVCGDGTRCQGNRCLAAPAVAPTTPSPSRRRTRHAQGASATAGQPDEAPAIVLKSADLKLVSAGDRLTGTEVIDLSQDTASDHELSQDELDQVFHKSQAGILDCLEQARGEAQVRGRLTVSFRVQRSGAVGGVRVEAPNYLMQHGLLGCIRPLVIGLRFPLSRSAQVVSYPFTLN